HVITDGRDSPPKSAEDEIKKLDQKLRDLGIGTIASVMGRYYAMDRDRRWERTEKAYVCLTEGVGNKAATPYEAVQNSYKEGKTDEFIDPTNIVKDGKPIALIQSNDAVIFFNYRIDRPRQLTKAFVLDNFERDANKITSFDPYTVKYYKTHLPKEEIVVSNPFQRKVKLSNLYFTTLTEYEKELPAKIAFPPTKVENPLGKIVSSVGFHQLRMAESEKERFVTFYFNGQNEETYKNEERVIVPSPKVPTYDQKPEMSSYELMRLLIDKMKQKKYQFILINFANPDMVGHTGNIQATTQAIKAVDTCLGTIIQESLANGYTLLVTGDHGNVEQKINPQTGQISTEHTGNPVPFIAIGTALQGKVAKLQAGILADIAPTVLYVLDIPKPDDMTGRNLLEEVS
ncbi:2,3-bisphosphoglycerate-independent phosphoglycerate mutase, partial [Candidatus Roizmanbacteria bacterium]|nr:2,3-bisphosphoglycerate-independent phosphoglycerate mutase [Candidatus Roizmanbacteria bacterium]